MQEAPKAYMFDTYPYTTYRTAMIDSPEGLKLVVGLLSMHVDAFCTVLTLDFGGAEQEIAKIVENLQPLFNTANVSQEKHALLSHINALAKMLYLVLRERLNMQPFLDSCTTAGSQGRSVKEIPCSSGDASDCKPGSRKPSRRLARAQLAILEEWYEDNSENPYLSNSATELLVQKTHLTVSQVRNWYVSL